MKFNVGKTKLRINISFAAVITLMLILDSSGMCAVALLCSLVHEAGHIVCLRFFGETPISVELSFYGIRLERQKLSGLTRLKELVVYASGPGMSFVFAFFLFCVGIFVPAIKTASVISLCIGAFNLIPCYPLDGGNILFYVLGFVTDEETAEKICFFASCSVLVPMVSAGTVLLLKNGNITLISVSVYLAAVCFFDKKQKDNIKI